MKGEARNLSCTPSFLAPFAKGFPLPLSHMRRYTGMQERSLDFARDDVTRKTTFLTCPFCAERDIHFRFVRRRYSPPYRHFERSREILLALCSSLPLSRKFSHFPLSHLRRYTSVQERSLGFARDDDTGATLSQDVLSLIHRNAPLYWLIFSLTPIIRSAIRRAST